MAEHSDNCEFCISSGGELLWENALCRVVNIADPDYLGFCRVILNRHVREMTDLSENEQCEMMRVVFAVEISLRRLLDPHKINLASLGNMTPHVHWHVIPRWRTDRCFPNPIWGQPQRVSDVAPGIFESVRLKDALRTLLGEPLPTFTPVRT